MKTAITKEYIIRELLECGEGKEGVGRRFTNGQLELVGKKLGMFVDREPVKAPKLEDLSTEDLMRLLAMPSVDDPPEPETTQ